MPEGEQDADILVELKAFTGTYDICISLNPEIVSKADCVWNAYENSNYIVLRADSPDFKRRYKYGIFVQPLWAYDMEYKNFTYVVTVSSKSTFLEFSSGFQQVYYDINSYKLIKLLVSPQSSGVTVTLDSDDSKA